MENGLNGIENFGHGLPEDGIVQAGITDVPQVELVEQVEEHHEEADAQTEDVPAEEVSQEENDAVEGSGQNV